MTARHSVFWLTLDASEITGVEITSTLPDHSLVFAVYPKFSVGGEGRASPPGPERSSVQLRLNYYGVAIMLVAVHTIRFSYL